MTTSNFIDAGSIAPGDSAASGARRPARIADDAAMLRAARDLTLDIVRARPDIYWPDFLASAALGYAAMAGAILLAHPVAAILSAIVAVFALYRAGSFIHELTHIKHSDLPGFRFTWNLLIGVPLLMPSFLYEGVHTLHHARTRYGTVEDPEYLPLALMKPWSVPLFVLVAMLAPVAMLIRFAVIVPLSLAIPPLRAKLVGSWSALSINPAFRRRTPDGEMRRIWLWQEAGAWAWSTAVIAGVISGTIPLRAFLIALAILSGLMLVNQLRTLVAHLWENEGEAMTVTAQYLDSVNVPPPGLLPYLWAPVGLRYHALHHLLPSLPYHSLGEAHRRLKAALEEASPYHAANHPGLGVLTLRLVRSTLTRRG